LERRGFPRDLDAADIADIAVAANISVGRRGRQPALPDIRNDP
jgi:hypothetical protein